MHPSADPSPRVGLDTIMESSRGSLLRVPGGDAEALIEQTILSEISTPSKSPASKLFRAPSPSTLTTDIARNSPPTRLDFLAPSLPELPSILNRGTFSPFPDTPPSFYTKPFDGKLFGNYRHDEKIPFGTWGNGHETPGRPRGVEEPTTSTTPLRSPPATYVTPNMSSPESPIEGRISNRRSSRTPGQCEPSDQQSNTPNIRSIMKRTPGSAKTVQFSTILELPSPEHIRSPRVGSSDTDQGTDNDHQQSHEREEDSFDNVNDSGSHSILSSSTGSDMQVSRLLVPLKSNDGKQKNANATITPRSSEYSVIWTMNRDSSSSVESAVDMASERYEDVLTFAQTCEGDAIRGSPTSKFSDTMLNVSNLFDISEPASTPGLQTLNNGSTLTIREGSQFDTTQDDEDYRISPQGKVVNHYEDSEISLSTSNTFKVSPESVASNRSTDLISSLEIGSLSGSSRVPVLSFSSIGVTSHDIIQNFGLNCPSEARPIGGTSPEWEEVSGSPGIDAESHQEHSDVIDAGIIKPPCRLDFQRPLEEGISVEWDSFSRENSENENEIILRPQTVLPNSKSIGPIPMSSSASATSATVIDARRSIRSSAPPELGIPASSSFDHFPFEHSSMDLEFLDTQISLLQTKSHKNSVLLALVMNLRMEIKAKDRLIQLHEAHKADMEDRQKLALRAVGQWEKGSKTDGSASPMLPGLYQALQDILIEESSPINSLITSDDAMPKLLQDLRERKIEVKDLQVRLSNVEAARTEADGEIKKYQDQCEQLRKDNLALRDQATRSVTMAKDVEINRARDMSQIGRNIGELEEQVEILIRENAELRAQVGQSGPSAKNLVVAHDQRLDETSSVKSAILIGRETAVLEEELHLRSQVKAGLRDQILESSLQVREVQMAQTSELSAVESERRALELELARSINENANLHQQVIHFQVLFNKQESDIKDLQQRVQDAEFCKQETSKLKGEAKRNEEQINKLEHKLKETRAEGVELTKQVATLQKELNLAMNKECRQCSERADQVSRLTKDLKESQVKLGRSRVESSDRDLLIAKLHKSNAEFMDDIDGLNIALEAKQHELLMVKREIRRDSHTRRSTSTAISSLSTIPTTKSRPSNRILHSALRNTGFANKLHTAAGDIQFQTPLLKWEHRKRIPLDSEKENLTPT